MSTTTLTIRVSDAEKVRLEALARSTGRSRSFLAAEAIAEYLAVNEWQVAGVKKAMASLDRGQSVSHKAVKDWVSSWDGRKELPQPKPGSSKTPRKS